MARRSGAHRVARRSGRGCRRLVRLPSRRGRRSRPGLLVPGPEPGAGEARPLPRGRHPRLGDDRAARARHRCPDGSVGGRRARRRVPFDHAPQSRSHSAPDRDHERARGGAAGRDAPRGASRILPALRPDRAGGRRSAARAPPPARARRVPSLARVCDALPRRLRRPGDPAPQPSRPTAHASGPRPPQGAPLALTSDTPLSGATGDVLDRSWRCGGRSRSLRAERRASSSCWRPVTTVAVLAIAASLSSEAAIDRSRHAAVAVRETAASQPLGPEPIARQLARAGLVLHDRLPYSGAERPRTVGDGAAPAPVPRPATSSSGDAGAWPLGDEPLRCWNGWGGFSARGDEYVIRMPSDVAGRPRLTPRPWINVLANPDFGALISESGAACTWSRNSREFRLTPWGNDRGRSARRGALPARRGERSPVVAVSRAGSRTWTLRDAAWIRRQPLPPHERRARSRGRRVRARQ